MNDAMTTGILIIITGVFNFVSLSKKLKENPWLSYALSGTVVALGIYTMLEIPLELPKIIQWILLVTIVVCLIMGASRFYKKKEQAEQETQTE